MNRNILIGGAVLVIGAVIYFVWKSRKPATTGTGGTGTAPQTPQPGGIFAPKTLTEADFIALENTFKEGNPYNAELAKAIEGQDQDENKPLKNDGSPKTLLTKAQFDNMVLAMIRQLIGRRDGQIQEQENRRFEPWRGAVRAGYADSLARAFAYYIRVYVAGSNYYTPGSTSGTTTNQPPTMQNQPASGGGTDYKSILLAAGQNEATANLNWKPTNIVNIIYADAGTRLFFNITTKNYLSKTAARTAGVSSTYII